MIWIDWMLTFRCCSLWCKCCGRDSKGHYSQKYSHLPPPCGAADWLVGVGPPWPPLSVGEVTFYPSSLVIMGERRQHTGHLFAGPSRAARCLRRHTKCLFLVLFRLRFIPSLCMFPMKDVWSSYSMVFIMPDGLQWSPVKVLSSFTAVCWTNSEL